MEFSKYHFFWIAPCIIAVIILIQNIWQEENKDDYKMVKLKARVKKNDEFQLFYVPVGQENFTEEHSIRRNVLGIEGYQTISFYFPATLRITKLRLDIGQNSSQEFVDIAELTIDNKGFTSSILPHEINPNQFIREIDGTTFHLQMSENRFDPFFEFNEHAIACFNEPHETTPINLYLTFFLSSFFIVVLWFSSDLIAVNRYSIYYVLGGLVIFFWAGSVLNNVMTNRKITITAHVIIKKDDILQLFLQSTKAPSFSEQHSMSKKIEGSDGKQSISFVFPDTADLTKIRLDLGQNIHQSEVEVRKITIERDRKLVLEGDDIFNIFVPNDFITGKANSNLISLSTKETSGSYYDPFIYSVDMTDSLKDLRDQKKFKWHLLPYCISFLFSSVFIFYLVFNFSNYQSPQKIVEYGFSFGFLILLVLPTVGQIFQPQLNIKSTEKRALVEMPKLKLVDIEKYPRAFENYYNDNFGFRDLLIQIGGYLKVVIFNASPDQDKAVMGYDKWVFLSGEFYGVIQDIKRENLLSDDQLKKKVEGWVQKRNVLAANGIKYYKAIWPEKHNVYPQYLPLSLKLQLKDTLSKTDQMILGLQKIDSSLEIIDVRKELIEAQKTTQVYLKNDTHWNDYGAFIGYQKLMQTISKDFRQILPLKTLEDYHIKWEESSFGDLFGMMGINEAERFTETIPNFVPLGKSQEIVSMPTDSYPPETVFHRNNNNKDSLRVIIFRDSFTRNLVKFISPHFHEVLYIWAPYDSSIVEAYKPDIVIECFVERRFE